MSQDNSKNSISTAEYFKFFDDEPDFQCSKLNPIETEPTLAYFLRNNEPKNKLINYFYSSPVPCQKDIDNAFIKSVKAIGSLLKDGKIDKEVANQILNIFVGFYVDSKVDSTISNYISKRGEKNYLLKMILESEVEEG